MTYNLTVKKEGCMKHVVIIVLAALVTLSAAVPVYANTRQENNKNIADFISDTVKLPWLLMGAFVTQDHEQVKKDLDYKEHEGLNDALRGEKKLIGK